MDITFPIIVGCIAALIVAVRSLFSGCNYMGGGCDHDDE